MCPILPNSAVIYVSRQSNPFRVQPAIYAKPNDIKEVQQKFDWLFPYF
jgi:hypothetical protein